MLPQPHHLNLQYFFNLIYRLLTAPWSLTLPAWVTLLWLILIVTFWVWILQISLKIKRQREQESVELNAMLQNKVEQPPERNLRWEHILKYLESDNPAEWKLAIIEADTMLDDLVQTLQPHGENLGERLKAIEPADFETLQDAWEAHKVRNQIAHEANFALSRREVGRVIGLFKKVFEEFEYI